MPLLNTAQFTLTDMTAKRSLGDRLRNRFFSVKEFGATGNGTTDDTEAIQATFDEAFGPYDDPHGNYTHFGGTGEWGSGNDVHTNPTVYFPAGDYMVSETLALNLAFGATLIGDGSHQTRIFWDPGAPEHIPAESAPIPFPEDEIMETTQSNISSVLECRMAWQIRIEGITIDASDVQQCAMRAMTWPANYDPYPLIESPPSSGIFHFNIGGNDGDDGSAGEYTDVHLTNAVHGFFSYGNAMGSERTWIMCRFTNCEFGHHMGQANCLNHYFYGCLFKDNDVAMRAFQGGAISLWACRFENSAVFDITQKQNQSRLVGCRTTSQNFLNTGSTVLSCTHDAATLGYFWAPGFFHAEGETVLCPAPGNALINGADVGMLICKGSRSTNGILHQPNPVIAPCHLVGNIFDDTDYLDTMLGPGLVDGVVINP